MRGEVVSRRNAAPRQPVKLRGHIIQHQSRVDLGLQCFLATAEQIVRSGQQGFRDAAEGGGQPAARPPGLPGPERAAARGAAPPGTAVRPSSRDAARPVPAATAGKNAREYPRPIMC